MRFEDELALATAAERQRLLDAPIIGRALAGRIVRAEYIAFLTQAYHHVRYTVPLMMAAGARLPERLGWLRKEIIHYTEEEEGHEQWVLADIAASGGDPQQVAAGAPGLATDVMIAYAWDVVMRRNPVGFFGMVYVLEGTSVALALNAAERIERSLQLPARAMSYLRSHGQLDREHVNHLAGILARLEAADDRQAVMQCARTMFRLYANIFYELDESSAAAMLRRTA